MLATTIHKSNTTPHHQSGATTRRLPARETHDHPRFPQQRGEEVTGLLSQSPIVCSVIYPPKGTTVCCVHQNRHPLQGRPIFTNRSAHRTPTHCGRGMSLVVLLRKEVIQPHLPVRLPCYDFVPIADPTFDRSLPHGLGHGLRVLPTFMT